MSEKIQHAFYGSFSGDRDYRILAASEKVGRKEKASIVPYSNMGISALKGQDRNPVYAFYELESAPGRWAFSRTTIFEERGRGNEYLVHVLVLTPAVLEAVRGDIFLLKHLLQSKKPTAETPESLPLDPRKENPPDRSVLQPGLLRLLANRSRFIAVPLADGKEGEDLCRAVFSILPPEDRSRLSFCSRFSQPRGLKFRLRGVVQEDAGEIKPYLKGVESWSPGTAPAAGADPYGSWMEFAKSGFEPLYGISALENPMEAAHLTQELCRWAKWIDARHQESFPLEGADEQRLVSITRNEHNWDLPSVRAVRSDAALRGLRRDVKAILQGGNGSLRAAVAHALKNGVEEDSSTPENAKDRSCVETTVGVALALFGPGVIHLDRVYGRGAWLARKEDAATWILELQGANPDVLLELLQAWFSLWQEGEGTAMLSRAMDVLEMIQELRAAGRAEAVRTAITALEAVAPQERGGRRDWYFKLFCDARRWLRDLFTDTQAARLALDGGILGTLPDSDLEKLMPLLVTTFARRVGRDLQEGSVPPKVLVFLLRASLDGLRGRALAGQTWDVCLHPEQWELASQVAKQAAQMPAADLDAEIFHGLTALLWEASRLLSPHWRIATEEADQRWSDALERLVSTCPHGLMDVAAWIVYRFCRSGFDSVVRNGSYRQFRKQALKDGFESQCEDFFRGTLIRLADLDRRRLAYEERMTT